MNIIKLYAHGRFKIIHVSYLIEGKVKSYTIAPTDAKGNPTDISGEPQEVQDVCEEAWTSEIIAAYEAHKAEAI